MIRWGGARQGKIKQNKIKWGQDWFEQNLIKSNFLLKQQKSCWDFTEILSRFQCSLNLNKVLSKIWAEVILLTVRNYTRINIKFKSGEIWDVKFIKSILTVVKKMKEFSGREITFSINIIFEKWRTVSFIKFKIQNVVDISSLIAILSNNKLLRFLLLIWQRISDYIT